MASIENLSTEDWSHVFDVNVHGYALMAKHIVPLFKQQYSGSIIQFASISGLIAQSNFVAYSTSKAAIIQMTKNLAVDLGSYNIRCNSISPGCTRKFVHSLSFSCSNHVHILVTPVLIKAIASQNISIDSFTKSYTEKQCLKRLGDPQEMANIVVFLASDLCPFITGANFTIDGGYTTI